MKVIKFKVWVSTGYINSTREDFLTIEVSEDATEDEINEEKRRQSEVWLYENIDFGYEE